MVNTWFLNLQFLTRKVQLSAEHSNGTSICLNKQHLPPPPAFCYRQPFWELHKETNIKSGTAQEVLDCSDPFHPYPAVFSFPHYVLNNYINIYHKAWCWCKYCLVLLLCKLQNCKLVYLYWQSRKEYGIQKYKQAMHYESSYIFYCILGLGF